MWPPYPLLERRIRVSAQWSGAHLGDSCGNGDGGFERHACPSSLQKISPILDHHHFHPGHKSLMVYSPIKWVLLDPTVQFNQMGLNFSGHVEFKGPLYVVHLDGPNSGAHPR